MRAFSEPNKHFESRTLRPKSVDYLMSKDENGNRRFQTTAMGVAFLYVIDDNITAQDPDAFIKAQLTTAKDKTLLPFPAYVIAGRHSTHVACLLHSRGELEDGDMLRACFVWKSSDVDREGALTLGGGENNIRACQEALNLTFLDVVRTCLYKYGNLYFCFLA
jgi:hypothetical protein